MSCHHKNIVLVGSDETGLGAARCTDCRSPLSRRIESSTYAYFVFDDRSDVSSNWRARP